MEPAENPIPNELKEIINRLGVDYWANLNYNLIHKWNTNPTLENAHALLIAQAENCIYHQLQNRGNIYFDNIEAYVDSPGEITALSIMRLLLMMGQNNFISMDNNDLNNLVNIIKEAIQIKHAIIRNELINNRNELTFDELIVMHEGVTERYKRAGRQGDTIATDQYRLILNGIMNTINAKYEGIKVALTNNRNELTFDELIVMHEGVTKLKNWAVTQRNFAEITQHFYTSAEFSNTLNDITGKIEERHKDIKAALEKTGELGLDILKSIEKQVRRLRNLCDKHGCTNLGDEFGKTLKTVKNIIQLRPQPAPEPQLAQQPQQNQGNNNPYANQGVNPYMEDECPADEISEGVADRYKVRVAEPKGGKIQR